MIAFLVFCVSMVAFIVGCVCISMRLGASHSVVYPTKHQVVSLPQEALIGERLPRPRQSREPFMSGRLPRHRKRMLDMGMGECVRRVTGVSLLIIGVVIVLIVILVCLAL